MAITLVTAPASEPLTTAEAKKYCRVDFSTDDTFIDSLVKTARMMVEDYTGRKLITQTWKYILERVPAGSEVRLPFAPLASVSSVKVYDLNDSADTMTASYYFVDTDNEPCRIFLRDGKSWPSPSAGVRELNAFEVQFVVGYGVNGSDVPQPLRDAIGMILSHLYENREAVQIGILREIPMGPKYLMNDYRIYVRAEEDGE